MSTKKAIERLCAEGRVRGIIVPRLELSVFAWRELQRELGYPEPLDGELTLVTCNGETKVALEP